MLVKLICKPERLLLINKRKKYKHNSNKNLKKLAFIHKKYKIRGKISLLFYFQIIFFNIFSTIAQLTTESVLALYLDCKAVLL